MMTSADWKGVHGGEGRGYMTESDVGTARDGPRPWVVVLPEMTVAEARELGGVIAGRGYWGRFVGGTVAEALAEHARWKQQMEEGGDHG